MTNNDGWGSKWPVAPRQGWPKNDPENTIEEVSGITPEMLGIKWPGFNLSGIHQTTQTIPLRETLKSQGSNLVDSEAYLYFQCDDCGEILDPHTKSFKTLQDKRAEAGWHIKWNINGMGYKVYCAECGEKVK